MGFLDSLKSLVSEGGNDQSDKNGYWLYARCNRCGEVIRTRIDFQRELNPRDEGGYVVRKTLVGNQTCFERIQVTLIFDGRRQLVDHEIVGGELASAEEFESFS